MSAGFDIRFTHSPVRFGSIVDELDLAEAARTVIKGRIQLGDYWETFISPLDVWAEDDYARQWRDARARLAAGAAKSCFVVTVDPPAIKSAIEIWGVWRLANEFRIQNLPLFPEEQEVRDLHRPYDALEDYMNVTEDGDVIHDWSLPLDTAW